LVLPALGLGAALGGFAGAAGADQLALGGVIARRQPPVAASGMAAPDPPPRVLAAELVKSAVAGACAAAGVPLWFRLIAGAAGVAASGTLPVTSRAAAGV